MIRFGRMSMDHVMEMDATDTVSEVVGIHGSAFVGIVFDAVIPTPATITFLVGGRKGSLLLLEDGAGAAITVNAKANTAIPLPPEVAGWQRLQLQFAALPGAASWRVVTKA